MSKQAESIAIVTGASRGIGAAIAKQLSQDGFAVIINYIGDREAADQVVFDIETSGGRAHAIKADVSNPTEVTKLFDKTINVVGIPNVLVNSAGIMMLAPLGDSDDELFDRTIAVNLKGTFNTMREASKRFENGGRIINLSTSVTSLNLPNYAIYAATKSAVETMTAILSKEMRGRSITVNAVAPGPTATDLFLNGKSDELIEQLSKMNPLERLATPNDIANTVSFLAGQKGAWINGQTIRANGGMI
ncbi:SDR family oxidoreductase [Cocleimonas flava]|uniref:3-oxoacyl-[acyl-carrier protein] reductase n=1 Tax=Cocleimonas flava TaxID=634765 RepID=A0A4R1F4T2_9GAMM|nr:SDR family oxidoreductase [Cocleimonas flava]TCJ87539.1 3-oxoacyl-[acyl-carrier protein] reductase [Cocleimonas flava]